MTVGLLCFIRSELNRTPSRERTRHYREGCPRLLRHGARSVARMPTAAQPANWTVGLGTPPMPEGHSRRRFTQPVRGHRNRSETELRARLDPGHSSSP